MVQSNSRVILLQKLLGECPSNLTPFWSSLCWDDSPLISLTRLGDGKGRAVWSLIGKTNFTPPECFLAGTKGETRLASHLSTLSIFPRLEGNWYEGFVLHIEEHESLGLCPHCSEVWFWEWLGEWSQISPLRICSATSGGSRDQVWWNTWCPSPRFSTTLECAGWSTAYKHRWKAWSQAHNGPENSVWLSVVSTQERLSHIHPKAQLSQTLFLTEANSGCLGREDPSQVTLLASGGLEVLYLWLGVLDGLFFH